MDNQSKLRLLYIASMLRDTDEAHALTGADIQQRLLEAHGMTTHRTTIPSDIQLLRQSGMEIETLGARPKKYYLNDYARTFDLPELKTLVDAVASSKFITKKKSDELIGKITTLGAPSHMASLQRNLWTEGRIKQENESIYYIIEEINRAINQGQKIAFPYFQYNAKKKRQLRHDGQPYHVSPFALVWNGDYYYMVGYSDNHSAIANFRVDRIARTPEILAEAAVPMPEDFDMAAYTNGMLRMYDSQRQDVALLCDNSVMDAIIDKFGLEVKTDAAGDQAFLATVNVAVTHVFFSWVFGFGGKVQIQSPPDVKATYRQMVLDAAKGLEG